VTVEIAERAEASGRLAIDTEFVSEGRYQALLCLVQVATRESASEDAVLPSEPREDAVLTEVLDPLDDLDPAPLADTLADPQVEIVLHAGRQDVAILKRTWGTEITRVFDTQVAAAFLGYGAQEGYEALCRRVLDLSLRGNEGFTHWDRRPLTPAQLKYAREDAAHLLELGEALRAQLVEAGRLEWALEECAALERSSDARDPDDVYARLPKIARLNVDQRGIARELVEWRERSAREQGRPAGWLAPDQALVEIARRGPRNKRELGDIRGVPKGTLHRRAEEVVAAVERGRGRAAPEPHGERVRRDPGAASVVGLAAALVRCRAAGNGLAPELLATQAELKRLVTGVRGGEPEPPVRVLDGWRREVIGAELLELLAGKVALRVGPSGEIEVTRSS